MDRKQEVLRQLREADAYVSGQQLCETLGVSRTAVWKVIKRLREEGYIILNGIKMKRGDADRYEERI